MNPAKIENVLKLNDRQWYDYFISKVADFEELWGIVNDKGWAVLSDSNEKMIVPFWPEKTFAQLCCVDEWNNYVVKKIGLDDFMNNWLPGLKKDGRLINIFLTAVSKTGIVIDPEGLQTDLKNELENYE